MRAAPPTPSRRNPDWRDQGACLGEDPDLFTPDGNTGKWAKAIEQAKTICGRCPVAGICTEWALDTPGVHGIYGGLTDDERRQLRRRRNKPDAECGTRAAYLRHQRRKEPIDDACKAANAADKQERKKAAV